MLLAAALYQEHDCNASEGAIDLVCSAGSVGIGKDTLNTGQTSWAKHNSKNDK